MCFIIKQKQRTRNALLISQEVDHLLVHSCILLLILALYCFETLSIYQTLSFIMQHRMWSQSNRNSRFWKHLQIHSNYKHKYLSLICKIIVLPFLFFPYVIITSSVDHLPLLMTFFAANVWLLQSWSTNSESLDSSPLLKDCPLELHVQT